MNIGQRIKEKRKELKISADELADRLGKDRSTIYRYEKGDIENLPLDVLEPIASALSTTPQYLMGWDLIEDKTKQPTKSELSDIQKELFDVVCNMSDSEAAVLLASLKSALGK